MIKRNKKGQWKKGNYSGVRFTRETSLGNKNAKGNPPNKTSFDGSIFGESHPHYKGGVQKMGKDCIYILLGAGKRVRRPKYVWEQVYGDLPKGYVIWHIDGNRYNDEIENLEAITRA